MVVQDAYVNNPYLEKCTHRHLTQGRGRPPRGKGRGSKSVACVRKTFYSSSSDDDEVVRQAVKAIRLANQTNENNRQKASTPVHFVRRSTRHLSMYNKPPVLSPEIPSEVPSSENADELEPRRRSNRGRKRLRSEPVNKKPQKNESSETSTKEKISPAAKKTRRRQ